MAIPNFSIIPPNGWHYIDGDVKLEGFSYLNLLKVVEGYRAENNLPVGDVQGDVATYLCGNWPHNCHGTESAIAVSVTPPTASSDLLNDIQVWAKNILMSPKRLPLVTDELAEVRAKTCLACPNNVNWRAGCSACINALDRMCANVRQARDTASTPVVGGCAKLRHDNRTAVFIDRDEFTTASDLPAKCWLNI